MGNLISLKKELKVLKNPDKAIILSRFFKTGPGQYGAGDIFLGITVPEQRKVAQKYTNLKLKDLQILLKSKIHEQRLTCLVILTNQFKQADVGRQKQIVNFYLKNARNVNNWDLVDITASNILGVWLMGKKDKSILYKLAKSKNLWERRIAMVSTFQFIKNNQFNDTLKLAQIFLKDKHDLIHKASGWMLREVGKRDKKTLEEFLKKQAHIMPRMMLRYAIEKFSKEKRKFYLSFGGPDS
ncbi:DNA alkylation repair protein [Patescibacteria group bacterium]|nr:DNA alkylation repair protein [Patescibacteria group bacterium]